MRIYLDVCCLNRPLDDQSQSRIRLESEAVCQVLDRCRRGEHIWVSSPAVRRELSLDPDEDRRGLLLGLLRTAGDCANLSSQALDLARNYVSQGLKAVDALHLALAEVSGCDILLTTDDRFLRRAARIQPPTRTRVLNPLLWISERLAHGQQDTDQS